MQPGTGGKGRHTDLLGVVVFEIGATIGGYEFIDIQDTLGLGVGYKVRNISANRFESLKVLPQELQRSQQSLDRFRREIKIHSRLDHPNVASFYEAVEIDRHLAITTEFLEGISLEQRLREGPLPLIEGVEYMCQALAGLGHAHEHGIVHRCVAPSSLIITREGAIKLTGFGFAKTTTDPQLTSVGFVIGMAGYVSPEQVQQERAVDGRSDLYSIGAVLYEIATGKPPFVLPSVFETLQAHVKNTPKPPSEVNAELSPEFDRMILRALAKKPSQRLQSAEEFREALGSFREALHEQRV